MIKPADKNLLPGQIAQNPSPVDSDSQDQKRKIRQQVDAIMRVFLQIIPSNYVSQVQGPFYTMQFQAAAEQIASFQITAQEAFSDGSYDYLRTEFLFQVLGLLVFPDAESDGYPTIDGDITYRQFLKGMVGLLLQGATKETIQSGLALLSDATFTVLEKAVLARTTFKKVKDPVTGQWLIEPGSSWGIDDQFEFEVSVSEGSGDFPEDPFELQENVRLVLRALKPAHTLYTYRHLFQETFEAVFSDSVSLDITNHYYEDFRRYCTGTKSITGVAGETLTDRTLLSDPHRDFSSVSVGSEVTILTGPNSIQAGGIEGTIASTDARQIGRYRVKEILTLPILTDSTSRAYTTTPSGLSGNLTISKGDIYDASQDWGAAVEGEKLTIADGPNQGTYRLYVVLGNTGGSVGSDGVSGTKVRVSASILRLDRRMGQVATGQQYEVVVDRLGAQEPRVVTGEDLSVWFLF